MSVLGSDRSADLVAPTWYRCRYRRAARRRQSRGAIDMRTTRHSRADYYDTPGVPCVGLIGHSAAGSAQARWSTGVRPSRARIIDNRPTSAGVGNDSHGKPTIGGGANASLLGTAKRSGGSQQVTYNGHPLYLFVRDQRPGDVSGQGVTAFGAPWFVLSAEGNQVSAKAASTSGGGNSGGSSGY
jgi:hypothetical protein